MLPCGKLCRTCASHTKVVWYTFVHRRHPSGGTAHSSITCGHPCMFWLSGLHKVDISRHCGMGEVLKYEQIRKKLSSSC